MRRLVVAVFAGLLALTPVPALAQGQNSAMQGRVLDESGGALPGVTVVVTHQGSGQFRQVVSNADGSYFLTNIIPGPYKVTADLTGIQEVRTARPGDPDRQHRDARHHARRRGPRGKRHRVGDLAARGRDLEADRREHRRSRDRGAADHEQELDVRRRPDAGHPGVLVDGLVRLRVADRRRRQQPERQLLDRRRRQQRRLSGQLVRQPGASRRSRRCRNSRCSPTSTTPSSAAPPVQLSMRSPSRAATSSTARCSAASRTTR